MEIRFGSPWEIKVDDNVDGLDVDTTGEEISRQDIPREVATDTHQNRQDFGSCRS